MGHARQRRPRLAVWAIALVEEDAKAGHRVILSEDDGHLDFLSSEGLVRKFFACEHKGGELESLELQFMETRFAIANLGDCIGRAVWPDLAIGKSFGIWDKAMPMQSKPRPVPKGEGPAPDSLEARLRAGFLAMSGRPAPNLQKTSRGADTVTTVQKKPMAVVDPDDLEGSSESEEDDDWYDKLCAVVQDPKGVPRKQKKPRIVRLEKEAKASSSSAVREKAQLTSLAQGASFSM